MEPEWTNEEHLRFIHALETYGSGNTGDEWDMITQHVGNNRTLHDIRAHAHKYFMKLQTVAKHKDNDAPMVDQDGWTPDEDRIFENALSAFALSPTSRCSPCH